MSRFVLFVSGIITGVYIAQNYNVPEVKVVLKNLNLKLSEYEKKNEI